MDDLAGTGRHMTTSELRLWTSFLDAGRIIDTELERHLITDHAMSHRDYEVLVRLDGADGRMRMSALARQIEASAPLVTQTVDRLVNRGWVRRDVSVEDRRGVDAVLEPDGRQALQDASGPHADLVRKLLLDRHGGDLDAIAEALGNVADHLRGHRRGGGCDDASCPLN